MSEQRSVEGPRELRMMLRVGDTLTVSRGAPVPVLESPLLCAFTAVARLVEENQPVRGDEWRLQSAAYHLGAATAHLGRLQKGDAGEDNLLHAATRLVMALQLRLDEEAQTPRVDG